MVVHIMGNNKIEYFSCELFGGDWLERVAFFTKEIEKHLRLVREDKMNYKLGVDKDGRKFVKIYESNQ